MEKVSESVYVETDFLGSTVGFVTTSEGVVMIDTPQKPSEAEIWRQNISRKGEVRYIINTDHHGDHSMGNGFFPGVVVAQHGTRKKFRTTEEFIERGRIIDPAATHLMNGYQARKPSITFGENLNLYVGDHTFELFHTPGHTENTIACYIPEEAVLFTGDNVCTEGFPDLSQGDLLGWFRSLETLKKYKARVVVPGHRQVGDSGSVLKFEKDLTNLVGEVKDAMDRGISREDTTKVVTYYDRVHERYPEQMKRIFGDKPKASVIRIYDTIVHARESGIAIPP